MEHTGDDAYFNKFNYRYFALIILDYLWDTPNADMHKEAARRLSRDSPKEWLTFFNALFNDMHYCFSSALEGIELVHAVDFAKPDENEQPIAAFIRQTEERARVDVVQRQSSFLLDYASGLLLLLQHLAHAAGEGLARQELAGRVAGVLSMLVDRLAGYMCVCVCIYIYLYVFMYICIYVCMCICVCV